jgi:hypothetical protein
MKVKKFNITDIPDTMVKKEWPMSARMMRRWFEGDSYKMTPAVKKGRVAVHRLYLEQNIVTMVWANQFPRVC